MATVLPFDPHRRRTPAVPLRRPTVGGDRGTGERVVPLPTHREPALESGRATRSVRDTVVASAAATVDAPLSERALAARFFTLALLVALLDLVAKAVAVAHLTDASIALAGPLSLRLAYNTVSAGADWLGAQTRGANVAATGVVVGLLVMLVPAFARLDRRAPTGLALMVGGGIGNLMSLAWSPAGVPDFLSVWQGSQAWVLNLADLSMLGGLLWLAAVLVHNALAGRAAVAPALPALPALPLPARPLPAGDGLRTSVLAAARAARRAAPAAARCLALVAVGVAGLLYAQRERMIGVTACVPGLPLVVSGANPFSRLDAAQRAETVAHEAQHAAQVRAMGCLAVYRVQFFGTPHERATMEVEAGCAELAVAPHRLPAGGAADSVVARSVVSAYPAARAVGFDGALAIARQRCPAAS